MTGDRVGFMAKLDPAARRIEVSGRFSATWTYTLGGTAERPTLVVEGTYKDRRFRAEATREPPPLLVTRGFHWINEVPYNR